MGVISLSHRSIAALFNEADKDDLKKVVVEFRGVTGPTGERGLSGLIGPTGPGGAQGDTGVGASGTQGPTGPSGIQGSQGSTGPIGPTGDAGSIGPTGIEGPTGPGGVTGDPAADLCYGEAIAAREVGGDTSWQERVIFNPAEILTGLFVISWSAEVSQTSKSARVEARIRRIDGENDVEIGFHSFQPKKNNNVEWSSFSGRAYASLSGETPTYVIEWRSTSTKTSRKALIRRVRLDMVLGSSNPALPACATAGSGGGIFGDGDDDDD